MLVLEVPGRQQHYDTIFRKIIIMIIYFKRIRHLEINTQAQIFLIGLIAGKIGTGFNIPCFKYKISIKKETINWYYICYSNQS